jgi:hypothetical protein
MRREGRIRKRSKRQSGGSSKPQGRKSRGAGKKGAHDSDTRWMIQNRSIVNVLLVCAAFIAIVGTVPFPQTPAAEPNMVGPLGPPVGNPSPHTTYTVTNPYPTLTISPEITWRTWIWTTWTTTVPVILFSCHIRLYTHTLPEEPPDVEEQPVCVAVSTMSTPDGYVNAVDGKETYTQFTSLPTTIQTTHTTTGIVVIPVEVIVTRVAPVTTTCPYVPVGGTTQAGCTTIYTTVTSAGYFYYYSTVQGAVTSSYSTKVPTTIVTTNTTTTRSTISNIATTTQTIAAWLNVPCWECYLKALRHWLEGEVGAILGFIITLIGICTGGWDDPSNWYNLYQEVSKFGEAPPEWLPIPKPTGPGGRPGPPHPGEGTVQR